MSIQAGYAPTAPASSTSMTHGEILPMLGMVPSFRAQPHISSMPVKPRAQLTHNQRVMQARRKILDGPGHDFVYKRGRRHHAFAKSDCPYPLACDQDALDLDIVDQNQLTMFKGSNTLVDWSGKEKPRDVLDLGCGNGSWIINMAAEWEDCRLTGLDIVPLWPDLNRLDGELQSRVKWVKHNFLKPRLPFADESFDFVHVKAIAKGVPEDKWDGIFEEVSRVLRPGGAIEVNEEDMVFPHVDPLRPEPSPKTNPLPDPRRSTSAPASRRPSAATRPSLPHQSSSMLSTISSPSSASGHSRASDEGSSHQCSPNSTAYTDYSPQGSKPMAIPHFLNRDPFIDSPVSTPHTSGPLSTSYLSRSMSMSAFHPPGSSHPTGSLGVRVADEQQRRTPRISDDCDALEALYERVFEKRFINTRPTSLLANLLNIHFTRTSASPYVTRYMPGPRRHDDPVETGLTSPEDQQSLPEHVVSTCRRLSTSSTPSFVGQGRTQWPLPSETLLSSMSSTQNMQNVRNLVEAQQSVQLHLHRVLNGVLACKEAMWEENQESQRAMSRSDFEALFERYKIAIQARIRLEEVLKSELNMPYPKTLGDRNNGNASEGDEQWSSEDSGRAFRTLRFFCAFKAG